MRPVLFDADAFRCLHGLKLLDAVIDALAPHARVVLTGYVAQQELNLLAARVQAFELRGALSVLHVLKGTPAAKRYRELQREADKGEAEAIAWALEEPRETRALFVTRDNGARKLAERHRVPVTDVMGIVVEACEEGGLDRKVAAGRLAVWDEPDQELCRPARYAGFDVTYAERLEQRRAWATES